MPVQPITRCARLQIFAFAKRAYRVKGNGGNGRGTRVKALSERQKDLLNVKQVPR